jgi:hypothetical protein
MDRSIAGIKEEGVMFLFTDSQITNEVRTSCDIDMK